MLCLFCFQLPIAKRRFCHWKFRASHPCGCHLKLKCVIWILIVRIIKSLIKSTLCFKGSKLILYIITCFYILYVKKYAILSSEVPLLSPYILLYTEMKRFCSNKPNQMLSLVLQKILLLLILLSSMACAKGIVWNSVFNSVKYLYLK